MAKKRKTSGAASPAGLVRGCGTRTLGGVYATTQMGSSGQPLDWFLLDPPIVLDWSAIGVSPIGVSLLPDTAGVYHIWDWVGEAHYPLPADFVEEVRVMGMSRRLPRNLDFSKLTVDSRVICIHAKASWVNCASTYEAMGWKPSDWRCRKNLPHHAEDANWPHGPANGLTEMCASLLWCDVPTEWLEPDDYAKDASGGFQTFNGLNAVTRKLTGHKAGQTVQSYRCGERPDVIPDYQAAAFLSLPITRLEVINDPVAQSHVETLKRASQAQVGVTLMNQ